MKDKATERWGTYESFFVQLGDKRIADIIVTNHAKERWTNRVESEKTGTDDICAFLWEHLKKGTIRSYYRNEQDVYTVEDDLVFVAEFAPSDRHMDLEGKPLEKMIIVTFLGRMSETMELRDLRTYYSWLRHSRRMTLIKNGRKKR